MYSLSLSPAPRLPSWLPPWLPKIKVMHVSRVVHHEVQRKIFLNAMIYAQTLATVSAGAPPPHQPSQAALCLHGSLLSSSKRAVCSASTGPLRGRSIRANMIIYISLRSVNIAHRFGGRRWRPSGPGPRGRVLSKDKTVCWFVFGQKDLLLLLWMWVRAVGLGLTVLIYRSSQGSACEFSSAGSSAIASSAVFALVFIIKLQVRCLLGFDGSTPRSQHSC